jgi:hypothetical protein
MIKNRIIGIEKVQFSHGGRYDTGFWTTGAITVIKEDRTISFNLSADDAEDLEYTLLKWLGKRKQRFGEIIKL